MIRLLALGVRLSWGAGCAGRVPVAAFVVLTSVALTGTADRQHQREISIAPRQDDTVTSLRGEVIADGWKGRELTRVVLAVTGPAAPIPPGLDRLPRPGEVALSPALDRPAGSEPLVARRFPQRRMAIIGDDGLVEPGQLLAYVGVGHDQLIPTASGIAGFGNPAASGHLDPRAARTVSLLILLTLVAPVVMFMATCARLSATARSQRLAALRLIGLTPARTHVVNAAETGIVGLAGSVAGLLAWQLWRRIDPSVTIGSFGWYSSDLRLDPAPALLTVAGLLVVAVTVGVLGGRPAVATPLVVRRERSIRRASRWRALPLTAGIGLLSLSWVTSGDSSQQFVTWMLPFGAGLLCTAVGLVIVVPAADAMAATCAELRLASAARLPDCRDGRTYRARYSGRSPDDHWDAAAVGTALAESGLPPASGELVFNLIGPDSVYAPRWSSRPSSPPPARPGSTSPSPAAPPTPSRSPLPSPPGNPPPSGAP